MLLETGHYGSTALPYYGTVLLSLAKLKSFVDTAVCTAVVQSHARPCAVVALAGALQSSSSDAGAALRIQVGYVASAGQLAMGYTQMSKMFMKLAVKTMPWPAILSLRKLESRLSIGT